MKRFKKQVKSMKNLKKPIKVDEMLMKSSKQQAKSLEKLLKTDEKLEKA